MGWDGIGWMVIIGRRCNLKASSVLIKTPPGSPLTEKIGYVVFDGLPKAFL